MRKVIIVPMIHMIPRDPNEKAGGNKPSSLFFGVLNDPRISEYWSVIKSKLSSLNLGKTRFYIDGYEGNSFIVKKGEEPQGLELEDSVIDQKVVKDFIGRTGGTVERTEDPNLMNGVDSVLISAFTHLRNLGDEDTEESATGAFIEAMRDFSTKIDILTKARDQHIADRVSKTLREDEVGVLFIGASHNVSQFLSADIKTELLDERLPDLLREIMEPVNLFETGLGPRTRL